MTIAERISRLPAAVNIAKPFPAQLTQAKSCEGRSAAAGHSDQSTTESSSLTKSLYAADRSGYTKADAVNKQWKKMNTVNLLDVLNGTADTSNRTLSAADVEKSLQKGGLLDEVSDIDLRMLQFELSGLGFQAGTAYQSIDSGEFSKNIEYLVSTCSDRGSGSGFVWNYDTKCDDRSRGSHVSGMEACKRKYHKRDRMLRCYTHRKGYKS